MHAIVSPFIRRLVRLSTAVYGRALGSIPEDYDDDNLRHALTSPSAALGIEVKKSG